MRWLVIAQGADLVTALVMIAYLGIGGEANPLVTQAYVVAGPLGLVTLKGGLIALLAFLRPRMTPAAWPWVTGLGTAFGVVGAVSNLIALGAPS